MPINPTTRAEPAKRTKSRLKLGITAEGVVFSVILTFITVGSILRNVNLLIVLAGMMFATLLMNWRVSVKMLSRLFVKRVVPKQIHAGQLATINWQCRNDREKLATWNLIIEDKITLLSPTSDSSNKSSLAGLSGRAKIPQLDVQSTQQVGYRVVFPRRGQYRLGPSRITNRFPFGLIRSQFTIAAEDVYVAPPIGKLTPTWDRRLQSKVVGSDSVERRKGFENEEFYGLREWRSGDSQRQIHWRSTARQGRLMVKEHDQRSNRDLAIVLDLWTAAEHDEQTSSEIETLLSFAATVLTSVTSAVEGQIAFGISGAASAETDDESTELLGDEEQGRDVTNLNHHWAGRNLFQMSRQIIPHLATASPSIAGVAATTDSSAQLSETIKQVLRSVSTGTPVFVISTRPQTALAGGLTESELANHRSGVENWINWLRVGSKEFEQLFQSQNQVIKEQLKSVSERWVEYVAR